MRESLDHEVIKHRCTNAAYLTIRRLEASPGYHVVCNTLTISKLPFVVTRAKVSLKAELMLGGESGWDVIM